MCSLGIPMLSAGQDMLRSKMGMRNTYLRGDLNAIDYDRAVRFAGTHEYFRDWIRFRLSDRGRLFRLASPPSPEYLRFSFAAGSTAAGILYNADHSHDAGRLFFAVNPEPHGVMLVMEGIHLEAWKQIADHERLREEGLAGARIRIHGDAVELPPLSCGLWAE